MITVETRPVKGQRGRAVCVVLVQVTCVCVCACLYVCVFICMCSVWVMGLSHRAKHSSPHGHNGAAQVHQSLNTAQFTMYRLLCRCVYLNRECQQDGMG